MSVRLTLILEKIVEWLILKARDKESKRVI